MEESQGSNQGRPTTFSEKNSRCNLSFNPSENNRNSHQEISDLTSNALLNYINQMLMEEEMDDKAFTYQEEAALHATEKSFLDIIGQDYPSPSVGPLLHSSGGQKNCKNSNYGKSSKSSISGPVELFSGNDISFCKPPLASDDSISDRPLEGLVSWQLQKGAEEAKRFIPNIDKLSTDLESTGFKLTHKSEESNLSIKKEESSRNPKSRKNPSDTDLGFSEGRYQKQIAFTADEPERNEMSDKVLSLLGQNYVEEFTSIRETLRKEMSGKPGQIDVKDSKNTKDQNNDQIDKELVDLKSLLIYCSEAVSTNNHTTAIELIKKIRKHSSPNGYLSQRVAHYFVDALEARLSGTGSEIYRKFISTQPTFSELSKACRFLVASCPKWRSLFYAANQTIFNIAKESSKVHIINYGIFQGFQWPSLFERFSDWESEVPKIRITVVEVPEEGLRPNKRVNLVGQRLALYARIFNVPFEYQGIVSKWENVEPDDLNIRKDEVVIVNCLAKSEMLPDEAIAPWSPRDNFLKTIRKIKPRVFIHGIDNGSYNSPYFVSRFRSTLSFFSSLFDMLDLSLPRDNPERLVIERGMLIPKAINVIACEGSERVERPETYKQWHARHLRAGFVNAPVDSVIMKNISDFVRDYYHKEFLVGEHNGWLLIGWKGIILYALSTCKPN